MIAIGSDHGGYDLKIKIIDFLNQEGIDYDDKGCLYKQSCNYPVYGKAVAEAVASGECDRGIVICSTGIGISIAANKVKGVRAALCSDLYSARMTRLHNDANVLAIGAHVVGDGLAIEMVKAFLTTEFSDEQRHKERIGLIE